MGPKGNGLKNVSCFNVSKSLNQHGVRGFNPSEGMDLYIPCSERNGTNQKTHSHSKTVNWRG
jgi:hypothetical protein